MATIKSPYTIKQFEEALRKFAYNVALETIQNLPNMKPPNPNNYWDYEAVTIKSKGSQLEEVDTPTTRIAFEGKTIRVTLNKKDDNNRVSFSLEEKIYDASSDNTRIGLNRSREDKEGIEADSAKIRGFLDKLMEGIEPERRFSLKRQITTGHAMQVPA
jgi:hypothetical protein